VFLDVPSRVELMGLLRQLTRERPLAVVVSTHDLELALRTADTVWLAMPGGELVTGAPEDVVLSGAIGQAFEGRQIRFHPEARSFRLLTGSGGAASVRGSGLRAALATAVLEREGYEVAPPGAPAAVLSVHAVDTGWRLWSDDGECRGTDFASLAEYLRGRRTGS
jgi:iron complex transport system ATP-binding protein